MSQPKEILCCITSPHIWSEHVAEVTVFARCMLSSMDQCCRYLLWLPSLDTSRKCFKHTSPAKRGFCQAYTLFPEGELCISYYWSRARVSGFADSCPPCRTKGRPSQAACNLHVGADSHMEWPEGRCDRVTFSRYVKLNSRVKLKVPAFPCCLFPSFR